MSGAGDWVMNEDPTPASSSSTNPWPTAGLLQTQAQAPEASLEVFQAHGRSRPAESGMEGTMISTSNHIGSNVQVAPQFMNGAQNFTMGPTTINTAGRDVNINQNYYSQPPPQVNDVPRSRILDWIGGPSYVNVYKEASEKRTEGTGEWFMRTAEFQELVRGNAVVLWATGLPGAGKTVLSAASVRELKRLFQDQPDVVVVYAFLRYIDKHSAKDILSSLLKQVVQKHNHAFALVQARFLNLEDPDERLTEKEYAGLLRDVIALFRKVYIVVDGLDEALNNVKVSLLRALLTSNANVLLMSRPLGDPYDSLVPTASRLSIQALNKDIDIFVRKRAAESVQLRDILQGNGDLIDRLCVKVQMKSCGMFLVAHLQMAAVEETATSVKTLFDILEALPSEVDALYNHALQRLEDISPKIANLAKWAFTWVACARGEIKVAEMQYALAVSPETLKFDANDLVPVSKLIGICGGLLEIKCEYANWRKVETFRFIHYTAKEWWDKSMKTTFSPNPHSRLAVTCIVHLERDGGFLKRYAEFRDLKIRERNTQPVSQSGDGNSSSEEYDDSEEDLYQCSGHGGGDHTSSSACYFRYFDQYLGSGDPFLKYAYTWWASHAHHSENEGPLHPRILSFLSTFRSGGYPMSVLDEDNLHFSLDTLHIAATYGILGSITSLNPLPYTRVPPADSLTGPRLGAGWTPFHLAACAWYQGHEVLRKLLPLYSGINDQDDLGRTPLRVATGYFHGVGFLVELLSTSSPSAKFLGHGINKLDVNLPDFEGVTPLMLLAQGMGNPASLPLLLGHDDIQLNVQDSEGKTALSHAAEHGVVFAVQALVASPGINLNIRDNNGKTPLALAAVYEERPRYWFQGDRDRPGAFKALLSHPDAECNVLDNHGVSPLMDACWNEEMVRLLLARPDIDVNLRNKHGETALMYYVRQDPDSDPSLQAAIEELIRHPDIDPNVQDNKGMTALMHCLRVEAYSVDISRALFEHPALDITIRDHDGYTHSDHYRLMIASRWSLERGLEHWNACPDVPGQVQGDGTLAGDATLDTNVNNGAEVAQSELSPQDIEEEDGQDILSESAIEAVVEAFSPLEST